MYHNEIIKILHEAGPEESVVEGGLNIRKK